jgi:hypothetical protein
MGIRREHESVGDGRVGEENNKIGVEINRSVRGVGDVGHQRVEIGASVEEAGAFEKVETIAKNEEAARVTGTLHVEKTIKDEVSYRHQAATEAASITTFPLATTPTSLVTLSPSALLSVLEPLRSFQWEWVQSLCSCTAGRTVAVTDAMVAAVAAASSENELSEDYSMDYDNDGDSAARKGAPADDAAREILVQDVLGIISYVPDLY